jgi:hypothetical protein
MNQRKESKKGRKQERKQRRIYILVSLIVIFGQAYDFRAQSGKNTLMNIN